jgi:7-cyano-7-deazaguanine synthase
MSKAIVVFSGGQDSTTVLGRALHLGYECFALAFNYGQKHAVELQQAQKIADELSVNLRIVDVREFGNLMAGMSALIGNGMGLDVASQSPLAHMPQGIPASFVPNRNALFLTIAHGYAQVMGANSVWTGVCETDYSGYPDCRANFVRALEFALNTGYQTRIDFVTPLMHLTKGETFKMAEDAGVLDLVINESHTCYHGVRGEVYEGILHEDVATFEWGHGCGECPACKLRANGWAQYQAGKLAASRANKLGNA